MNEDGKIDLWFYQIKYRGRFAKISAYVIAALDICGTIAFAIIIATLAIVVLA